MRTRLSFIMLALSLSGCVYDDALVESATPPEDAAAQAALIEDGRAVAEANCSVCHAIGRQGRSPNASAPPFRTLLRRYRAEMLETELAEGMSIAHAAMPQFQLKPEAAGALVAYLRSVQLTDPSVESGAGE